MRRYLNHIKRIEQSIKEDNQTMESGAITKQSELIRQYLHDEITAEEFEEQSEVKQVELTPKQQQYRDEIFEKYLPNYKGE